MQKQILTPKELMTYLGLGKNSTYELLRSEGFPVIQVGRLKLIPINELNEWIKEKCRRGTNEQKGD